MLCIELFKAKLSFNKILKIVSNLVVDFGGIFAIILIGYKCLFLISNKL